MANRYRGESRLEVENVVYTLVYHAGTIVSLESKLNMGFIKILRVCGDEDSVSFTVLRVMLFEGLRERHRDITLEQAGDMIIAAGFGNVLEKIVEGYTAAVTIKADDTANPREPSQNPIRGTGSE